MATSGSVDFSIDRNGIINAALRLIRKLPEGGTATATQISDAAEALNLMVKTWQADGLQLWALKRSSFSMVASQANYTVTAMGINRPLRIKQAFIRNTSSGADSPVRIITREEYWSLGNKSSTGTPTLLYYDPQLTAVLSMVYLYPAPDATAASDYTLHIIYSRPFEDFDASTDTPDFPQEWYEAIKYGLAVRLAPEYGVPLDIRNDLKSDLAVIKRQVMNFDQEDGSIFFVPDMGR